MHNAPDNDIIDLVLKGQQKSYAILIKRYQHYVFTLALRYTSLNEDAEELTQDVFIKAYKSLNNFNRTSKFSTWLYTITKNTCLSYLRKKNLSTETIENLSLPDSTKNHLEQKSEKEQLKNAINMLPQDDGIIISLFYIQEQSIQEIAQILSIESTNVKVKLHRARKKLKTIIESHFKEELLNRNK